MGYTGGMNRTMLSLLFLAFSHGAARGEIGTNFSTNFVFKAGAPNGAAVWSDSLVQTKAGLGRSAKNVGGAWIETPPIPVGLAFRPPTSTMVTVRTQSEPAHVRLGQVYIRHGADRKHWSNWMLLTPGNTGLHDPHPTDQSTYTITLQVPEVDRKRFGALYQDWKKADPNWDDDVDAYARWLLKQDPAFFRKHLPFIGYVQIRMEHVTQRDPAAIVVGFDVSGSCTVSGMSSAPRRAGHPVDQEASWHLDTTRRP